MDTKEIIAQGIGLLGMVMFILSFQPKSNKSYFIMQISGSLLFIINFLLIGAYAGLFMNIGNIIRNVLFIKSDRRVWKLITVEVAYIICIILLFTNFVATPEEIALSLMTSIAALVGAYCLWLGNGKVIRYTQVVLFSPVWIVYDVMNFTLGGIISETFNGVSSVIAIIRYRKRGFIK